MDFARLLNEIREKNYSDIEIAEEMTTISKVHVTRQMVFNYRTKRRPNPAVFEVALSILKLHKRVCENKGTIKGD